MKLLFTIAVTVQMLLATAAGASGGAAYSGRWQQISSSAGDCSNCVVSITRSEGRIGEFIIEANNGWTATLSLREATTLRSLSSLQGIGEWKDAAGRLAGRKFRIALINDSGVLQMMMIFSSPPGRKPQVITAGYILAL